MAGPFRAIKKITADSIPPANPYRAILRRDYPEPFIALLLFVLGIWLWDHYFGTNQRYEPGTEEVALIRIDRDLRLSEVMAEDPVWLRFLAGAMQPQEARKGAMEVFRKLAVDQSLSPKGLEAFAIVKSKQEGLPMREVVGQIMQGQMITDFEEASRALANHRGNWWHANLISSWEESSVPAEHWRTSYGKESLRLRARAVTCGSVVWGLGLFGLFFVPGTLRKMGQGTESRILNYGDAWTLPLGTVVFLVSTLAWIGFTMTLDIGIGALPNLHPAMGIFLDSAARLLPSLIALALLFRRPSHVVRVIGLNKPIAVRAVLGTFALLMIFDQILRRLAGAAGSNDPGGGLSLGDAGWWGLSFAVVSACLLAPVAEEILYRAVLFRSFRNRLGVLPAALVSAAIFAVVHFYDGYGLASVGVFGLSCALLYSGTGSLTTVIALHMLYNTAIKLPEWIVYHAPLG